MARPNTYTEISSSQEDFVIGDLDLTDETIESIKEVIESLVQKAYDQGFEDGEEQAVE